METLTGRITIDENQLNGKPAIRGKRISVQTILEFLSAGESEAEILKQYPSLEPEDIKACLLFASRLREYQRDQKCPSSTAQHNLAIASEGISDAALRLYHALPNDPLRHTGEHTKDVPDNRRPLRVILGNTLKVCSL